jgi:hypothetical protein
MIGRHVHVLQVPVLSLLLVLALQCCNPIHTADAFVAPEKNTHPGQRQQPLTERRRQQQPSFAAPSLSLSLNPLVHGKGDDRVGDRRAKIILEAATSSASSSSTSEEDMQPSSTTSTKTSKNTHTSNSKLAGSKLRQLKDIMWVRETTEDLTAAEFACTVESGEQLTAAAASTTDINGNGKGDNKAQQKRSVRRAVDYEKLLNQLNRRIRDMGCDGDLSTRNNNSNDEDNVDDDGATTSFECYLQARVGMGSLVYTDKQREALLNRMIRTRQALVEVTVIRGRELELEDVDLKLDLKQFAIASLPEIRMEIPKEDDPTSVGPKLYVRDDGTVDWDGALQDQAALGKFGTAVWARINGRDPESIDKDTVIEGQGLEKHSKPKVVMAKIEDTQQIKEARERLGALSTELVDMERAHTALLSSAISAGQAVANVNLATLEPAQRSNIRESAEEIVKMKEEVSLQTLIYELERIYTYLVGELGNPALNGYIPLQDRLNVAEFGLLESQIDSFNRLLDAGDYVDADVLSVVMDQLTDFKRRLGIDYYVTGLSFDREAIMRWLGELIEKSKKGLAFYNKGVRLFWDDIVFSLSLINRAAQGYTLKPREVRTIR